MVSSLRDGLPSWQVPQPGKARPVRAGRIGVLLSRFARTEATLGSRNCRTRTTFLIVKRALSPDDAELFDRAVNHGEDHSALARKACLVSGLGWLAFTTSGFAIESSLASRVGRSSSDFPS